MGALDQIKAATSDEAMSQLITERQRAYWQRAYDREPTSLNAARLYRVDPTIPNFGRYVGAIVKEL